MFARGFSEVGCEYVVLVLVVLLLAWIITRFKADKPRRPPMPEINVVVTVEDIMNGVAHSASCCPIALAMERATGEPWLVEMCELINVGTRRCVASSVRVQKFVAAFDSGEAVGPFSFTIGGQER